MRLLKSTLVLFVLATLLFTLPGCETKQPYGIYQNDKINSGLRDKMHSLNDALFASAKDDNAKHDFEDLLTKELAANPDYKQTVDMISNESKSGKYTILDEYYLNNKNPGYNNDITSASKAYKIGYRSSTAESYISLMLLESGGDKWLITAAYSKLDYGWKVSELYFGRYAINGRTATELLSFSKEQHAKGYIINALNNMELATKCLRPAPIWEYANEKQIGDYYGIVAGEAYQAFKFPIIIPIPSKPAIFRIMNQTQKEGGYVPTIRYITKVDVRDSVALKAEFESIKKAIGKALPGVDHDNKLIIFSAYNQRPMGGSNPLSFDMLYKPQ